MSYHSTQPELDFRSKRGLKNTPMAPQFIMVPMTMKDVAKEPVLSDKTPPTIGPIKLEPAWKSRIKP